MKTIVLSILGVSIVIPLLVAVVKIALFTNPGVDDCVQVYAKELKEGRTSSGFIYSLPSTSFGGVTSEARSGARSVATHIDKEILPLPVKGKSYGCINVTDDKFADYFNSVYCGVAYLLK